jgi:hypothetical protein
MGQHARTAAAAHSARHDVSVLCGAGSSWIFSHTLKGHMLSALTAQKGQVWLGIQHDLTTALMVQSYFLM